MGRAVSWKDRRDRSTVWREESQVCAWGWGGQIDLESAE